MSSQEDIGIGTEPESSASLDEHALLLWARLRTVSAHASEQELQDEILAAFRIFERDTLLRAAEVCTELAHARGESVESFATECVEKFQELAASSDSEDPTNEFHE